MEKKKKNIEEIQKIKIKNEEEAQSFKLARN